MIVLAAVGVMLAIILAVALLAMPFISLHIRGLLQDLVREQEMTNTLLRRILEKSELNEEYNEIKKEVFDEEMWRAKRSIVEEMDQSPGGGLLRTGSEEEAGEK